MKRIFLLFFALILTISPILAYDLQDGLVASWPFEDGTGTIASELINNYDGTLINYPLWIDGKIGGGLEFDGIGQYVEVGNPPLLNINDEITISMWVFMEPDSSGQRFISKGNNYFTWYNGLTGTGYFALTLEGIGVPNNDNENSEDIRNEWHHLVFRYDGYHIDTYTDGERTHRNIVAGTINVDPSPLTLGGVNNEYFKGRLDEIAIWDRALTSDEIILLWNSGMGISLDKIFAEKNQTYDSPTVSRVVDSFSINVMYNDAYYSEVIGKLIYNGEEYPGIQEGSEGNYVFSTEVQIPQVEENTDVDFYWTFEMTHADDPLEIDTFNSTTQTQTIRPNPIIPGDADCNGFISISDAVYLIAYIFGGGPPPCVAEPERIENPIVETKDDLVDYIKSLGSSISKKENTKLEKI